MLRRLKIQVKPNQYLSKRKNDEEEEKSIKHSKTDDTENNNNSKKVLEDEGGKQGQQQQQSSSTNLVASNERDVMLESFVVLIPDNNVEQIDNTINEVVRNEVATGEQDNTTSRPPPIIDQDLSTNSNNSLSPKKAATIVIDEAKQQQQTSSASNSSLQNSENNQFETSVLNDRRSKERPKEKLCDTKKFTMADLIKWRPRTENTFRKKWSTKRKNDEDEEKLTRKTDESSDDVSTAENSLTPSKKGILEGEEAAGATPGPRVRINEQGEMVVDEDSLIIMQNPENNQLETVINDDIAPKKLTSMSFRKRSRGSIWSIIETDLFYEVLAATGTDFGLMHEFIPKRTRVELKQKFNREHRINPRRMDETLRHPVLLDGRLRQRVERYHAEMAK